MKSLSEYKKFPIISALVIAAASSAYAVDYTISADITDPANSITASDGDTINVTDNAKISGSGVFVKMDGTDATTAPLLTFSTGNRTLTFANSAYLDVLKSTFQFIPVNQKTSITVEGATADTAGSALFKDSTVITSNTAGVGAATTFNANGYGSIVFDNSEYVAQTWYSAAINVTDNGLFKITNGSVWDFTKNGTVGRVSRGGVALALSGSGKMIIDGGSTWNPYQYVSMTTTFVDNSELQVSGTGTTYTVSGSHGTSNLQNMNFSGNAKFVIADGATLSSNNAVLTVNLTENSALELSNATYTKSSSGSSKINASGSSKINMVGTSTFATSIAINMSENASFNIIGANGSTIPSNVVLSDAAAINIKGSSTVTAGTLAITGTNTSVNVSETSAITLGNVTVGSETSTAAAFTVSGADSSAVLPNRVVTVTDGGSFKVLKSANLDLSSGNTTTITVNGTSADKHGSLIVDSATITTSAGGVNLDNAKYLTASGFGEILIKDSTVNFGNRYVITLSENGNLTLNNSTWTNGNRINKISMTDNASFNVLNGSSFTHFYWVEGSPFEMSGNSKILVDGVGSKFMYSNGNSYNNWNLSGSSSFTVQNSAEVSENASVYATKRNMNLNLSENASFNVKTSANVNIGQNNGSTLTMKDNSTFNVSDDSVLNLGNVVIGVQPESGDIGATNMVISGANAQVTSYANTKFTLWGAAGTSATNQLGGGLKFVADADGISTLNVVTVEDFSGIITLDFSNLGLVNDFAEFVIVSAANDWESFAEKYTLEGSEFVKVIKANAGDTYEIGYASNKLFVNYYAVPEPATYAAIFGALALAFAAYKRRNISK